MAAFLFDVSPNERRQINPIESLQHPEHLGIADHSMLNYFREALPEFARGQSLQHVHIGNHQRRLVPRPDEIFARGGVHSRLAPNGAVDLGDHGCRNVNESDAAQVRGSYKADDVADHPAADSDYQRFAIDA